jgi:cyclopropane fatty-acyl-phospholipid synthase-like methyltransferase
MPDGARPPVAKWGTARVAAVEALWGSGFSSPGGAPETLRLAGPLGLNADATLLLLGGGMGGPAETIAESLGAWVESAEADPELAAIAEQRRMRHGAARKISIGTWDRANPCFGRRSAHHAMALESLRGAKLAPILDSIAGALRPKGHIVLTELIADGPVPDKDREFAAWCRLENRGPDMPSHSAVTAALTRRRFDVRVVEDLSDRHVTATLSGWRSAVKAMAAGPRPDAATAGTFVTEAELWLLRIRLMRRLGFRLLRWHAVGTA